MGLGRILGRREQDRVSVDVQDRADLQPGGRHDLIADDQASGVVAVYRPYHGAVFHQARRSGHDVEEYRVVVLPPDAGRACGRVDVQHLHASLISALDHDEQGGLGPMGCDQVLERGAIPFDLDAGPVHAEQPKRDVGVGRTGRGIGHPLGPPVGMGRICDIPAGDHRGVDPGDQEGGAVRGPPVAAGSAHFFRRHELGQPEGHFRSVRLSQRPLAAAIYSGQAQGPTGDIGHFRPGRVGPRIEDRMVDRQLADIAVLDGGQPQPAGQRKCHRVHRVVGGVADYAISLFAKPLTAGELLRRHLALQGCQP